MRPFVCILNCILICLSAGLPALAAEPDKSLEELKAVLEKVPGHRVEADYAFSLMQGKTAINCTGHAVIQENLFHIVGNGMEIYCNGTTITYLDPVRKEAYIENAVRLDQYVKANLSSIRGLKTSRVSVTAVSDNLAEFDAPVFDEDWVVTDLR